MRRASGVHMLFFWTHLACSFFLVHIGASYFLFFYICNSFFLVFYQLTLKVDYCPVASCERLDHLKLHEEEGGHAIVGLLWTQGKTRDRQRDVNPCEGVITLHVLVLSRTFNFSFFWTVVTEAEYYTFHATIPSPSFPSLTLPKQIREQRLLITTATKRERKKVPECRMLNMFIQNGSGIHFKCDNHISSGNHIIRNEMLISLCSSIPSNPNGVLCPLYAFSYFTKHVRRLM